jgi:hypothetical protein
MSYLVEGKEYPYNYIHKLLNYGIQASKNSTTASRMSWSLDNTILHIDGDDLSMTELKEFVLELLEEAENMCASDLLFTSDGRLPKVDLHELKRDNPAREEAGYYFAIDQPKILDDGRRYIFERLMHSKVKDKICDIKDGELEFYKAGVNEYENGLKKFKLLVCILIIFMCGQIGRGTELTSLIYMNTMNGIRGVYILDGQVMIVTKYHKLMALMDALKVHIY